MIDHQFPWNHDNRLLVLFFIAESMVIHKDIHKIFRPLHHKPALSCLTECGNRALLWRIKGEGICRKGVPGRYRRVIQGQIKRPCTGMLLRQKCARGRSGLEPTVDLGQRLISRPTNHISRSRCRFGGATGRSRSTRGSPFVWWRV
jgi:hypothetical protein